MRISGVSGQISPMGSLQGMDQESKNLQRQIAEKQKQLQDISSNDELTMEEKMKKRQEIQKEITDLNCQLRQHQMDQRKEKQQAKGSSMDEMLGASRKSEAAGNGGLSQANMKAMLTADSAMNQSKIHGSVASEMEGRAGILKGQIKQDAARGANVEQKQEELAEVEAIGKKAASAQISDLAEANKKLEAASKETGKAEDKEKAGETDKAEKKEENNDPVSAEEQSLPEMYVPVDIRL